MSFGGHVFDMIGRLKQNNALLKLQERYRELRDMYYDVQTPAASHKGAVYKKLTKQELEALKKEIARLERRDIIVKVLAFIIALIITVGGMYFILS